MSIILNFTRERKKARFYLCTGEKKISEVTVDWQRKALDYDGPRVSGKKSYVWNIYIQTRKVKGKTNKKEDSDSSDGFFYEYINQIAKVADFFHQV